VNILHVLDHSIPLFSGYAFRSNYIITNQREHGYKPFVVTSIKHVENTKDIKSFEVIDGIEYYRVWFQKSKLTFIPFLNELFEIYHLRNKIIHLSSIKKFDIIHAHSPSLNGLAALWASKSLKKPIIYEVRAFWEDAAVDLDSFKYNSLKYRISKFVETCLLKKVNHITTICHGLNNDLIKRGIDQDKITIIPNGIEINKFPLLKTKDMKLINKYDLSNKFVIGFIGSFYHYEGIDDLIHLMSMLREDPSYKLLLVGSGPVFPKIESLVRANKLSNVELIGKVNHAEIISYYSIMDVLVYPRKSIRLTELVTPLKPLEAMALGIPVIGSDIGGLRELINHGVTGLLFKSGDLIDLKEKIISLRNNSDLRFMYINSARKNIVEMRDWKNITRDYHKIYNSIST